MALAVDVVCLRAHVPRGFPDGRGHASGRGGRRHGRPGRRRGGGADRPAHAVPGGLPHAAVHGLPGGAGRGADGGALPGRLRHGRGLRGLPRYPTPAGARAGWALRPGDARGAAPPVRAHHARLGRGAAAPGPAGGGASTPPARARLGHSGDEPARARGGLRRHEGRHRPLGPTAPGRAPGDAGGGGRLPCRALTRDELRGRQRRAGAGARRGRTRGARGSDRERRCGLPEGRLQRPRGRAARGLRPALPRRARSTAGPGARPRVPLRGHVHPRRRVPRGARLRPHEWGRTQPLPPARIAGGRLRRGVCRGCPVWSRWRVRAPGVRGRGRVPLLHPCGQTVPEGAGGCAGAPGPGAWAVWVLAGWLSRRGGAGACAGRRGG